MSDRLDVNSIIRAFLPNLGVGDAFISDPYIYPLSVVGRSFGDLSGPLRIKLDDLFQAHEKISTSLIQAKAVLVQTSISKGMYTSTKHLTDLRQLNSAADEERENARHQFFCKLTDSEKAEFDFFCLQTAGPGFLEQIPQEIPTCFHGALARFGFEKARIRREFDQRPTELQQWQRTAACSRSLESSLRAINREKCAADERLIGRWFRELTAEQWAVLEGRELVPHPAEAKKAGRPKASRQKGDAEGLLIPALTSYHNYGGDGDLNLDPIGNNELARRAHVDKGSASNFFKKHFKGHTRYASICRDPKALLNALKVLNGDFPPHKLSELYDSAKTSHMPVAD